MNHSDNVCKLKNLLEMKGNIWEFQLPHFIIIWIYATQINIVVLIDFFIITILKFYDLIQCFKPYWPREPQRRCLQSGDLSEMTGDSWGQKIVSAWCPAVRLSATVGGSNSWKLVSFYWKGMRRGQCYKLPFKVIYNFEQQVRVFSTVKVLQPSHTIVVRLGEA